MNGEITIKTKNSESELLFKKLVDEVMENRIQPEDKFEVAAYLESVGWNDSIAAETFGCEDIFELAEDIWEAMRDKVSATPIIPVEKRNFFTYTFELLRRFLRGMIFALPMAISVIAMLTLRFSLWSYEFLSTELATSIAIGTILSFITVGGFTQSIARRGFFYITQGYYNMARNITFYFVRTGYLLCFILASASIIINLIFQIFPMRMVLVINLFYFFLSAIWLSVTVMYILQKEIVFTGLLTIGIIIVFFLFKILGLNIIVSQIISLAIIAIIAIAMVFYYFKAAELKMERGIAPALPRKSITLYSVMPYFVYGFLYFSFLYIDRIMAWSANDKSYMPYLIWFRGPYELGLDFALLMLMIPMGFIEVIVTKLMTDAEISQKNCMTYDVKNLNRSFIITYIRRLLLVTLVSILCAAIVYLMVWFIDTNYSNTINIRVMGNVTTNFVFISALIGYSILSVGLMNAIILFSLSQPEMVNRAISKAVITNICVGFLLSRWMSWWTEFSNGYLWGIKGYSFAIIGLVAGSIVFMILSTKEVIKVLGNLDYYLYAAS